MVYNNQLCLSGLGECKGRLLGYIKLKTNIQEAINLSLIRLDEYRRDFEYFKREEHDREMTAVSVSLLTAEKVGLQKLFGLRNYCWGKIRETEHEKRAWEEVYFDNLVTEP